jgi:hypothetical protein
MSKTYLVPSDFSHGSERALDYTVATSTGARAACLSRIRCATLSLCSCAIGPIPTSTSSLSPTANGSWASAIRALAA